MNQRLFPPRSFSSDSDAKKPTRSDSFEAYKSRSNIIERIVYAKNLTPNLNQMHKRMGLVSEVARFENMAKSVDVAKRRHTEDNKNVEQAVMKSPERRSVG